jgi:hypothetical protein
MADGTACKDGQGRCTEGICFPKSCSSHADCDDGNPCNGTERCSAGTCIPGTRLECDDGSPCTEDVCRPDGGGCRSFLIDRDLDGHAPSALGACGQDCNDRHAGVGPSASEVCDGRDNDCDGRVDEGQQSTWYVDCDGDGWAAAGAIAVRACAAPSAPRTGCAQPSAGWTPRAPTGSRSTDCHDGDPDVYPKQDEYQREPISGAPDDVDFDYNCDGVEEALLTGGTAECSVEGTSGCVMERGWVGAPPQCGQLGLRVSDCRFVLRPGGDSACVEVPSTDRRVQRCR